MSLGRGRPKRQHGYLRRAAQSFLEGTRCRTPEDAVLRGIRTLEEWVDVLGQAREARQTDATFTKGSSSYSAKPQR